MTQMHISAPRHRLTDTGEELAVTVTVDGREWPLWFQTSDGPIAQSAEPFLALALLPAMHLGVPIRVDGAVSTAFLGAIEEVKAAFKQREPTLTDVAIEVAAQTAPAAPDSNRRVAVMFSGGVDSFAALYEHLDEIDDLVFVRGFDMPPGQSWLARRASRLFGDVAASLGKRLVKVDTNLRVFGDHHLGWSQFMQWPAMGALAHLFGPTYQRVHVAADFFPRALRRTPGLTEMLRLWGSAALEVVPTGGDRTRLEKLRAIVGHDPVRRSLRVCWENNRGAYNCCECEKCLRNMAMLRALGCLHDMLTFNQPLDLDQLAHVRLFIRQGRLRRRGRFANRAEYVYTHEFVEAQGTDPALAQALSDALNDVHYRGPRYQTRRVTGRLRRLSRAAFRA